MFTNENEWSAAYAAAANEIRLSIQQGLIRIDPNRINTLAVNVANAAIRSAQAVGEEEDITTLPEVTVERTYYDSIARSHS